MRIYVIITDPRSQALLRQAEAFVQSQQLRQLEEALLCARELDPVELSAEEERLSDFSDTRIFRVCEEWESASNRRLTGHLIKWYTSGFE